MIIREKECLVHHYKQDHPKGLVIVYHGFLAHGNYPTVRYACELLSKEQYAVVSVDMIGHGMSEGLPGYLSSAKDVTNDGVAILNHAKTFYEGSDLKIFLIGSSMGGCIALSVAQAVSTDQPIAGTVLLAPMLKLNVSSVERTLLQCLSVIVGSFALIPSSASDSSKQCRDPEKLKEIDNDPLCKATSGKSLRVSSALACVDMTVDLQEQFSKITCPFLCMVADEDVVVKNEGCEDLFTKSISADKTKKHYPALHALLCETEPLLSEIHADILKWVSDRTG